MNNQDKNTIEYLKKLIKEVKKEMQTKKMITESKTPQDVFKNHQKNIKEYVADKIFEVIKNSES